MTSTRVSVFQDLGRGDTSDLTGTGVDSKDDHNQQMDHQTGFGSKDSPDSDLTNVNG